MNEDTLRLFYRKWSRALLKETATLVLLWLRGSSVGPALHEIICSKLLLVTLEWGLTFDLFYGAHGEDISTRVMFHGTHARLWLPSWSQTVESLVSSRFVLGKLWLRFCWGEGSEWAMFWPRCRSRWKRSTESTRGKNWWWLHVWFPFVCRKRWRRCCRRLFRRLLCGSLWFVFTDRISVVTPSHEGWDEVMLEQYCVRPRGWNNSVWNNSCKTPYFPPDILSYKYFCACAFFKKKTWGNSCIWKLEWFELEILSVIMQMILCFNVDVTVVFVGHDCLKGFRESLLH